MSTTHASLSHKLMSATPLILSYLLAYSANKAAQTERTGCTCTHFVPATSNQQAQLHPSPCPAHQHSQHPQPRLLLMRKNIYILLYMANPNTRYGQSPQVLSNITTFPARHRLLPFLKKKTAPQTEARPEISCLLRCLIS